MENMSKEEELQKNSKKKDCENIENADIKEKILEDEILEEKVLEDNEISINSQANEMLIKEKEKKILSMQEEILRLHAETENLHKRTKRDIENAYKFSLKKFANELIPVIDSLENSTSISCNTANDSLKPICEGLNITIKMFIKTISNFGIEQINPVQEKFDHNKHEAVTTKKDDKKEEDTILHVFQKGYTINSRIIRPARVLVVKNQ